MSLNVNTDIAARVKSYELAVRMQLAAPEVVNVDNEPKSGTRRIRHRR